ncbi:MAG: ABC transporter ATP-binding protein [Gammaproteobacteria bacterium]|nr:ABC transporter ATP-binding protein [Gammaproteobacteria bacterium]
MAKESIDRIKPEDHGAEIPAVRLRGLGKVFVTERVETHALSDVALDIRRGEYVLVQGPSGCGKSTLLSILGLLDQPSSGEYVLLGQNTRGLRLSERARLRNSEIGFVFQSFNLIEELTVLENVELPLRYRKGRQRMSGADRAARAMALIEDVGIGHRAEHYPAQLSGGQQQRAAVARALIGEPSLILADEPTGNLDPVSEDAVMELLTNCHGKGTTLCVVSHNPKFSAAADRVVRLSEGRLDG